MGTKDWLLKELCAINAIAAIIKTVFPACDYKIDKRNHTVHIYCGDGRGIETTYPLEIQVATESFVECLHSWHLFYERTKEIPVDPYGWKEYTKPKPSRRLWERGFNVVVAPDGTRFPKLDPLNHMSPVSDD